MVIGICTIQFHLEWSNSLKDKRREIKSLISRVRAKFNVSVAETGCQDEWRSAVLSFALVATDRRQADRIINEVTHFIEINTEAEIISIANEII